MELSHIENIYGFKIKDAEKIKNIYRLKTDKGVKCLKRAHMSPSYFRFIHSAVAHLKSKSFDHVIPYEATVDGSLCVPEDKYVYYITNWIESRECRFKDEEDLKHAIKTAAEFHRASHGYKPPDGAKPRVYYGKWIDKFQKKCIELLQFSKSIEEKEYISEFDEIYARYLTYYWKQGKKSIEMIKSSNYETAAENSRSLGELCHHDMANHNFIVTPDSKMYMIDFDYCIMDTRLHDISSLVIRNMRYGIWSLNRAYFILNEYSKHFTISKDELKIIKAFMTFPQDFWQVGLQYYVENQPWALEHFLMRINRIVDDTEIREEFLNELLVL